MEELKKLKITDEVTIGLKGGDEVSISPDTFETFKVVIDKDIKSMLEEGAPYLLPSVDKAGFEGIIDNLTIIQGADHEKIKKC